MTPTEALTDLSERLNAAEYELLTLAGKTTDDQEARRLDAKASGVSLAHDYVRYAIAIVEDHPYYYEPAKVTS